MNSPLRHSLLVGVVLMTALLTACGSAQSRKAGYIRHGQEYLAAGNYDKARVEFSNAAQIDPKDATVRYLLGQVAEKLGDIRGAVGQYQAAVNEDPKQSAARASLARLLLYGGLADKALELVEPGLTADPKNPQLLTARGAARAQLGQADAALADAQAALQLAPTDEYAIALLSSLYKNRGQLDQAVAVVSTGLAPQPNNAELHTILADLYMAQQHPEQAETELQKVINLDPKVMRHRYILARFYLQQKNVDAAEKTLRDAVASAPSNVEPKLQLVELLAAQRGRDKAAAEADQMTAAALNDDKLRLGLGDVLGKAGMPEKAEAAYRAVIAHAGVKPDGLTARDRLAGVLLARNDVAGATTLITEVLRENPRDNEALDLRGNLALAQGNVTAAITDLRAVLRDQPNALPVMRTLARAYQRNNENDLAEETLRSAVQIAPKDFGSRLDLAQILIGANKFDQANPLLDGLAKERPNDIAVQEALFRVQAAQKHFDEAHATAEAIEQTHPDQGLGYYLAGLVEQAQEKPDLAVKNYQQALEHTPNAGEPLTALVQLELQRKQPAAAMAHVDAALAKSAANPLAHKLKGELLLAAGKPDAAVAADQETLKAFPAWADAYTALAIAQLQSQHGDAAISTLQLGIQKAQATDALVVELANLYQHSGRTDDAIALYQGILDKTPTAAYAANNLAMLLVTYKTDAASLARAQKLSDQLASSSMVSVMDTRGWVKFKTGDYHGAESLLQQAVDKAPNAPEFRYHLGMAQLKSGEVQAAQQNLESAVNANKPFAGLDDARATLAQLKKSGSVG
jgi:tetratricopeptide (TPR) repeat protein